MYWHYGCQFAADMAQRHSAIPAAKPHTAFTVTLWQLDWGPYPRCWLLLQQHSWATKNGVNGRGRVCGGVRACSGGPAVGPIAPAVGVQELGALRGALPQLRLPARPSCGPAPGQPT